MPVKQFTIDEFDPDESFYADLRDRNFCLVLGAGFSYGVKNRNKDFPTIPTSEQFVNFTKNKFKIYDDGLDIQGAVAIWENQNLSNGNLIAEFRDLFLVDDTCFDFGLFSSVFIPNWYSIFTFNFDNVLSVAKSQYKEKEYPVFHYPLHSTDYKKDAILHLHGLMNENSSFSDIVFSSTSYSHLSADPNTFYNLLYGYANSGGKNLIILGTQFNEQIVFDKFFKGLTRKDIKICHFDLKNVNIVYKKEFTDRDYTFINLQRDAANLGTRLFLEFLQKNRDKIENIHIDGADIINPSFIENIKKGKTFSKTEFYTAKQYDACQWFGVVNRFDVARKDYEKLKTVARNCFDIPKTYKVAAIVYGTGGSGKSTLLRRLAYELHNEKFKVIWLKEGQFENFTDKGLKKIESDPFRDYLVLIEDWYRLVFNRKEKEKAREFLLRSQILSNLRIIIGDREISGKAYLDNLPERENIFLLEASENIEIIPKILKLHSDWKIPNKIVLNKPEHYKTSLFILLYIIARVAKDKLEGNLDFSEPRLAFQNIVKSDLKKIYGIYPGLAKALHYWACIYTNYKVSIDLKSFLIIADAYDQTKDLKNELSNWNINSPILDLIKNFVYTDKNESSRKKVLRNIETIQFNQDKLAEEGLAEVGLDGYPPIYNPATKKYDDVLLKHFLNIVVNNPKRGNDAFPSILLAAIMTWQNQIFKNGKEKIGYINKLYESGNLHTAYLHHLSDADVNLTMDELKQYLYALFEKKCFPQVPWLSYFKKATKAETLEAARLILINPDLINIQHGIVVASFNQYGNEDEKLQAAKRVLDNPNIISIQPHIVTAVFKHNGNKVEKLQAAKRILENAGVAFVHPPIINAAFKQNGNEDEKLLAAKRILNTPGIVSVDPHMISAAFKQIGNEDEKLQAAKRILDNPGVAFLHPHIVSAAFKQNGNEDEKLLAAKRILKDPNFINTQNEIIVAAFNQNGNEDEKLLAAKRILSHPHLSKLTPDKIATAFKQPGNDLLKQNVSRILLESPEWDNRKHLFITMASLKYAYSLESLSELVTSKVKTIIDNFFLNRSLKLNRDFYYSLMQIPLHNNPIWNTKSRYILRNWQRLERRAICNVLKSYKDLPNQTKRVCIAILKDWRNEIKIEIEQVYYKPGKGGIRRKGDHIVLSLFHPYLVPLAQKTAKEIIAAKNEDGTIIPDDLFQAAILLAREDVPPTKQD